MCVNKSNISIVRKAGGKHKCHADLVEQHVIRQLISAREYTKPVRFFSSVDARKRLKPASTDTNRFVVWTGLKSTAEYKTVGRSEFLCSA